MTPDQAAATFIAEAQARGWTRDETIAGLSTGKQESGWRMVWSPNHQWYGFFQQDASYPNRMDPLGNIRGFLDRLDAKRTHPGWSDDMFANIFWVQQGPNWPSADHGLQVGRKAYYDEIRQHIAWATRFYASHTGGTPVPDNRPPYNEFPIWSSNNSARGKKPTMFLLHTQEGGGGDAAAENLAKWFQNSNNVSYHYTISQASDGGVTVVDCVDTDRSSWSVGNANPVSINLCFAGSCAAWTREQWMKQANAIDVAAYLAVQDARKYGFPTLVVPPPYTNGTPGISDHRWVTDVFKWGTHTDVGPTFPWDVFAAAVAKYSGTQAPSVPPKPAPKQWPKDYSDRELLEYIAEQLGPGHQKWKSKGMTLRDKLWSLAGVTK